MSIASLANPNICADCEQLLFDNSPTLAAAETLRTEGEQSSQAFSHFCKTAISLAV
jgi:hypothetical protein